MAPTEQVTFVFTDIEGSTQLLQKSPEEFPATLETHNRIIRAAFGGKGGVEVDVTGDGFFFVFHDPVSAVLAAAEAQRDLASHAWAGGRAVRVRMGIHSGYARQSGSTYIGLDVHKTARVMSTAYGGQILVSSVVASSVRDAGVQDLGIYSLGEFQLRDLMEPEVLFMVQYDGAQAGDHPTPVSRTGHTNIPERATPLVGRAHELESIQAQIQQPAIRLLTLAGPGGIGKTSLAMEAARGVTHGFKDGAFVVMLAPVTESQFLPHAIAHVLDVFVGSGTPVIEQLLEHLREKEMLLVLDNMEHLVPAAPVIRLLLEGCPALKIIVTSRIVLRLSWEHEFPVPPLEVAIGNHGKGVGHSLPSVELFIMRAQAVSPHFTPTESELQAIAEICARLDGLPLAIELAAARIKVLPPAMILSRLCKSLDLLKGGTRDLPERHQAMRHTISWSYELLRPYEQQIFRWLGVFSGGFSLEAAEALNTMLHKDQYDGLELVTGLRDQSLIRVVNLQGQNPRYMMLQTIREFALEQLDQAGEREAAQAHHMQWYLECAEEAEQHFTGANAREWLDLIEADLDNFRGVLKWTGKQQLPELGLRLCNALWRYWVIRGLLQEGGEHVRAQLAIPGSGSFPILRAKALNALGTLRHEMSDYKGAAALLPEAIALFREHRDESGLAVALNNLSWVEAQIGLLEEGAAHAREAHDLHQANLNTRGRAVAMGNMAFIALSRGDYDAMRQYYQKHYTLMGEARDRRGMAYSLLCQTFGEQDTGRIQDCLPRIEQAIRIIQEVGDRQMMSWANTMQACRLFHARRFDEAKQFLLETIEQATLARNRLVASYELVHLAATELKVGNMKEAKIYLDEVLVYARERGSKLLEGLVDKYFAEYYILMGQTAQALEHIRICFDMAVGIQNKIRIIDCCELIAMLYCKQGNFPEATELLGCADAARNETGLPLQPSQEVEVQHCLATLRSELSPDVFELSWTLGQGHQVRLLVKSHLNALQDAEVARL